MKTALLVVDIQTTSIEVRPYTVDNCLFIQQKVVTTCRGKSTEVIYARHNDDELLAGSRGWEIYEATVPEVDEKIFDKHYNSVFKETHLQTYLDSQVTERLVITDMTTNYCIDATIEVAFEFGYNLVVIKSGTTAFAEREIIAEQLIQHYESAWNRRFVQVASLEEISKED